MKKHNSIILLLVWLPNAIDFTIGKTQRVTKGTWHTALSSCPTKYCRSYKKLYTIRGRVVIKVLSPLQSKLFLRSINNI